MALPRPGQLSALVRLITRVADAERTTETEIKISLGLLTRTPWGVSDAGRSLTRASASAMITRLQQRLDRVHP
jgi:hypothetical protein